MQKFAYLLFDHPQTDHLSAYFCKTAVAVDNRQESVTVQTPLVAGDIPADTVNLSDDQSGLFRLFEIPFHNLRTADKDHPFLTYR